MYGDFNVGGQLFQWNDGIFSITLGKRNMDGFRTAYFHPMVRLEVNSLRVFVALLSYQNLVHRSLRCLQEYCEMKVHRHDLIMATILWYK